MSIHQYDLIVFGATSFVGKIITQYLIDHTGVGRDVVWAIAGRSESKLKELRESLGSDAESLPMILADSNDSSSLDAMCSQARVIISTVGPYALYGEPLIKACVESGTDYCDLTGEPHWVKQMQDKYEQAAKTSGARIVHCCGFDSIPSDLGMLFLQQQAKQKFGHYLPQTKLRVKAIKGGFSGGTYASMAAFLEALKSNPELRRDAQNPYSTCPKNHGYRVEQSPVVDARFDADGQYWLAPFALAAMNERVVLRSNALAGLPYGDDFTYNEAVITGKGLKGRATAVAMASGLKAFMAGISMVPLRALLEKLFLPSPGEGPSPEEQLNGFYDLRIQGKNKAGEQLEIKVVGNRDPGYGSTAKIFSQAGLCLALDISKEDKAGGFWTPATVFGDLLVHRLEQHAGVTFQIVES